MIDRSTGTARADRTGSNWIELLAALLSTVANLLIYAIYRDFMGRESSQIISNHLKSCCLKPIAAGQPHFTLNSFCSLHRDSRRLSGKPTSGGTLWRHSDLLIYAIYRDFLGRESCSWCACMLLLVSAILDACVCACVCACVRVCARVCACVRVH